MFKDALRKCIKYSYYTQIYMQTQNVHEILFTDIVDEDPMLPVGGGGNTLLFSFRLPCCCFAERPKTLIPEVEPAAAGAVYTFVDASETCIDDIAAVIILPVVASLSLALQAVKHNINNAANTRVKSAMIPNLMSSYCIRESQS